MLSHLAVRNAELAPKMEADIRERIAGLSRYHDRITSCSVTVDIPQRHRKSDTLQFRVRLDIALPGGEIVINRQPRDELRTAVQEAFSAARRRLQDFARRQDGAVKAHGLEPTLPLGKEF